MKIVERVIRYLLLVMIACSLYLSFIIWTNSETTQSARLSSENALSTAQTKKQADVFVPMALAYQDKEQAYYSNRINLLTKTLQQFTTLEFGKAVTVKDMTTKKYVELQKQSGSVVLMFADSVRLADYIKMNELKTEGTLPDKFEFTTVLYNSSTKTVYFFAPLQSKMVKYQVKNEISLTSFVRNVRKASNAFPAELNETYKPTMYTIKNNVELEKYSYILANQSYTVFSSTLFGADEDIYSNDSSENIHLTNSQGERLTVDNSTGLVNFTGKFSTTERKQNIYQRSFNAIANISGAYGDMRYFEREGRSVIFRNYVEGFPVFGNNKKGIIEVDSPNQTKTILMNQQTIQVPVPSSEKVTLPDTATILLRLNQIGIATSKVENLQIGYTWTDNQTSKQVIELNPEWYIRYQGKWSSYSDLATAIRKGTNGGVQSGS